VGVVGLSVSGAIVSGSVLGGDGGLEPTRSSCSENIINKISRRHDILHYKANRLLACAFAYAPMKKKPSCQSLILTHFASFTALFGDVLVMSAVLFKFFSTSCVLDNPITV